MDKHFRGVREIGASPNMTLILLRFSWLEKGMRNVPIRNWNLNMIFYSQACSPCRAIPSSLEKITAREIQIVSCTIIQESAECVSSSLVFIAAISNNWIYSPQNLLGFFYKYCLNPRQTPIGSLIKGTVRADITDVPSKQTSAHKLCPGWHDANMSTRK